MKYLVVALFFATQIINVYAAKQYQDFTDTQGRTIKGCIVSYNEKTEIVVFERSNKRTAKVSLSIFSKESQAKILSLETKKNFTSKSTFKISATRQETKNKKKSSDGSKYLIRAENANYEIVLENMSNENFNNIKIEYCIYYEQEENADADASKGVLCGSISDLSIPKKSKETINTDQIIIFKSSLNLDNYYSMASKSTLNGEILGIWIRVHTKLPSGENAIREYSRPDKILKNKKWRKSSIDVGLNKSKRK